MAASWKTRSVLFKCLTNFAACCWSFRANLELQGWGGGLGAQNLYFPFRKKARRVFCYLKSHKLLFFSPQHRMFPHSPATGSWPSLWSWHLGTRHPSAPPPESLAPPLICQWGPVAANAFTTGNPVGEDNRRAKLIGHSKQISHHTAIIFGHYFHKLDLNWWPPASTSVPRAPQFPSVKALILTSDSTHVSALPLPVTLRPSIDIWLNRYPSSTSFLVAKCPVGLHKSTQQERSSWVSCLRSRITSNS